MNCGKKYNFFKFYNNGKNFKSDLSLNKTQLLTHINDEEIKRFSLNDRRLDRENFEEVLKIKKRRQKLSN